VQVPKQEVDVQASLVGLVDDDHVIGEQLWVMGQLRQQDAVGHDLDRGLVIGLVVEPNRIADCGTEWLAKLIGDTGGDRAGSDTARLGMADDAVAPQAGFEADLGELGAFA